uniref:Osteocrin n=1 Tax=Paramormyrops kingsleyae TaxID=1676925 RepID=A0A3B3R8C0_9TELE
MWYCGYILVSCLFTVTLFSCSATGFQVLSEKSENDEKSSSTQKDKLLLLDQLVHVEKNAIEIKRKRSFPGENMPLDRLSVSTMDTKSKAVSIPRRQMSVPIDRIGIGRFPSKRG